MNRFLLVIAIVMTLVSPVWAKGFSGELRGDEKFSDTAERWVSVVGQDTVMAFDRIVAQEENGPRKLLYPEDTQWYLYWVRALKDMKAIMPDQAKTLAQEVPSRVKRGEGPPYLFLMIKLKGEFPKDQRISAELLVSGKRITSEVWPGKNPKRPWEWEVTTSDDEVQYRILVFDVKTLSVQRPYEVFGSCALTVTVGHQVFDMQEVPNEANAALVVR